MASKKNKPAKHYTTICVVLYDVDVRLLGCFVAAAKKRGYTATGQSDVIRYAIRSLGQMPDATPTQNKLARGTKDERPRITSSPAT